MSFLALAYHELSADCEKLARRETDPHRKRRFEERSEHYHAMAQEREIEIYQDCEPDDFMGEYGDAHAEALDRAEFEEGTS